MRYTIQAEQIIEHNDLVIFEVEAESEAIAVQMIRDGHSKVEETDRQDLGVQKTKELVDFKLVEKDEYCFSLDEEYWDEDTDYILDNIYDNTTVYVGIQVKMKHKDYLSAENLICDMQQRAYDDSEYAEGYLEGISKDKKEELSKIVLDYLNKNIGEPRFYKIRDTKEISVEEFKKRFC